jgi:hypothetical protein
MGAISNGDDVEGANSLSSITRDLDPRFQGSSTYRYQESRDLTLTIKADG